MRKRLQSWNFYPYLVVFIVCLSNFVPNYAQYQASPLGTVLMEQFQLSQSEFAVLFTAPFLPGLLLSLFSGIMMDKFGIKKTMTVGLIATTVGCVIRVIATSFWFLYLGAVLSGICACFLSSGAVKLFSFYFAPEKVGSKLGMMSAASNVGMTVAMATTAMFTSIPLAFSMALIGALLALILWTLLIEEPQKKAQDAGNLKEEKPSIRDCFSVVFRNRTVWLISVIMYFVFASSAVLSTFIPTALATKGIDPISAGYLGSAITIGNFVGCFVGPFLVRVFKSLKITILLFGCVGAVGTAFSWLTPSFITMAICLFITGTVLGSLNPLLMATPVQIKGIGSVYAGTSNGIMTTIGVLGSLTIPSYVLAPIAGENYVLLFFIGAFCPLLVGLMTLFIPKKDLLF